IETQRLRKINRAGVLSTVAGTGKFFFADGPASQANFRSPYGVTLDNAGNFYIGDRDNQRIRRVDTQGMVKTVAGNARFRQVDDNTPATRSYFFFPRGMVFDPAGNLYVADSGLKRIRKITANGAFSTFAGPDSRNCCIVDGQRQDPLLGIPIAMVVDGRQN